MMCDLHEGTWLRRGVGVLAALIGLAGGCASVEPTVSRSEPSTEPWFMQATRLDEGGRLVLTDRPWWPRAVALKVGESFMLPGGGRADNMLVRRERVQRARSAHDAIVWVIDDDGDGSLARGGDTHDDCYIVDYDADGRVDRIVDYMDDEGDGRANEMDIRYFVDGELRYCWFGLDLDGDGHMWDLKGYEYSSNFFASDPYGDNMIYMNKYDPTRGAWVPISECPFAFIDTDRDGYSEIAVRFSAAPLSFAASSDPDFANDLRRFGGPWYDALGEPGVMNVRYSFDIDGLSGPETPLHYDFGFNLVGAEPYPASPHLNRSRRPPQVTHVLAHDRLQAYCETYSARQTGFSWVESHDDTIAIGNAPRREDDFRWEGVFWMWERRFMSNTGGPTQRWNVRREWSDRPADRRRVYYSGVDRRLHLVGAREGWIQVGHFAGLPALGEVRMFDTDGNGYFDRWEVYTADAAAPVRVTTVRDERARELPFDIDALSAFYMQEVLLAAMQANAELIAAMSRVWTYEPPASLRRAAEAGPDNMRRYAQDIWRELHYRELRAELLTAAEEILKAAKKDDLRPAGTPLEPPAMNSATAWRVAALLSDLDQAYGSGDFTAARAALDHLVSVLPSVRPAATQSAGR